jgi:hypothetical protein
MARKHAATEGARPRAVGDIVRPACRSCGGELVTTGGYPVPGEPATMEHGKLVRLVRINYSKCGACGQAHTHRVKKEVVGERGEGEAK